MKGREMNKSQLVERAREIGGDIVKLVNEYRVSSGEAADQDEEYYSEFFAGVISFLCTGNGTVELEYDADPKYNLLCGSVTHEGPLNYPLQNKHIDTEMSVTEKVEVVDGKVIKSYSHTMDPITYMELLTRTELSGKPIFGQKKVIKGGA